MIFEFFAMSTKHRDMSVPDPAVSVAFAKMPISLIVKLLSVVPSDSFAINCVVVYDFDESALRKASVPSAVSS